MKFIFCQSKPLFMKKLLFVVFLITFVIVSYMAYSQGYTLTVSLEPTETCWNCSVKVSGTLRNETGPITGETVYVKLEGLTCSNTTDTSGKYTCMLNSPPRIGIYTVYVWANISGSIVQNETTLVVRLRYGSLCSTNQEVSCIKIPIAVVELDGSVQKNWLKICSCR